MMSNAQSLVSDTRHTRNFITQHHAWGNAEEWGASSEPCVRKVSKEDRT